MPPASSNVLRQINSATDPTPHETVVAGFTYMGRISQAFLPSFTEVIEFAPGDLIRLESAFHHRLTRRSCEYLRDAKGKYWYRVVNPEHACSISCAPGCWWWFAGLAPPPRQAPPPRVVYKALRNDACDLSSCSPSRDIWVPCNLQVKHWKRAQHNTDPEWQNPKWCLDGRWAFVRDHPLFGDELIDRRLHLNDENYHWHLMWPAGWTARSLWQKTMLTAGDLALTARETVAAYGRAVQERADTHHRAHTLLR